MPSPAVSLEPPSRSRTRPPGPSNYLLGEVFDGLKDPLSFNLKYFKKYGDCISFSAFPGVDFYLFVHPEGVEHILQTHQGKYQKPQRFREPFGLLGGQGILTSDGEFWLKQRRLIQPAFHREQLARLGSLMTSAIEEQILEWEQADSEEIVDLFQEMTKLTFRVIGRSLFGDNLVVQARQFCQTLDEAIECISARMNSYFMVPAWLPTPANRKLQRLRATLDEVVYEIIGRRREMQNPPVDLLDMLMRLTDDDSAPTMNDRQLRDEIMTLLVSGHETVALALSWTLYLHNQNPAQESILLDELNSVLGGRSATMTDLHRLPYNKMVFAEALRLYPPIWGQPRQAREDDEVQGYFVPKGAPVTVCQYVTHRHPEFWEDPERFEPERFLPEKEAARPKFAYFPFGGGGRACIGNNFALAEGQLAIATMLQRLKFDLLAGQVIEPRATCTLRPKYGIKVRIRKRR